MNKTQYAHNYLEEYLYSMRSKGRYSFTRKEAKSQFNISDKALNQNLYRLKSKKRIAQIRKNTYAIIVPEYSQQGMIPINLFIDDMMKSLEKRYYVGLISAAALHGAAHQQPMEHFVVTEKPALRDIKNEKLKINFFVKKGWADEDVVQKKTDAGYMNVSSPELTALDLFYYIDSMGINRTTTILKELTEEMKPSRLTKTAKAYLQTAAVQRLGYILDVELQNSRLAEALFRVIKEEKCFYTPLLRGKENNGSINRKWKIIQNTTIEADL